MDKERKPQWEIDEEAEQEKILEIMDKLIAGTIQPEEIDNQYLISSPTLAEMVMLRKQEQHYEKVKNYWETGEWESEDENEGEPDDEETEQAEKIGNFAKIRYLYIAYYKNKMLQELKSEGGLMAYLTETQEAAEAQLIDLGNQIARKEGITEEMLSQNPDKYKPIMNNIKQQAREMVIEVLSQ